MSQTFFLVMGHAYWAMGQYYRGSLGNGSLMVTHCLLRDLPN